MRILSGIQPSGQLHLGNYFGMMKNAVALQEKGEALYFIADWHSLTTIHDPEVLRHNVHEVALDFLACGLDPAKATFFVQSQIPEIQELAWILSSVTPMGLLERAHSFKDKVARGISPSHGLFAYPVLMAADILMYDSNLVPVGKDQKQHLEMTREIAQKLNHRYGEGTLVLPEEYTQETTATVLGLDGQKMSKSYNNTIPIFGEEKAIRKRFMKIVTDTTAVEDPKPTENSHLLDLYRLFANDSEYQAMVDSFKAGGQGYGHYKQQLFEAHLAHFQEARTRRAELEAHPKEVEKILHQGAEKARSIACKVLDRIRNAVGLR